MNRKLVLFLFLHRLATAMRSELDGPKLSFEGEQFQIMYKDAIKTPWSFYAEPWDVTENDVKVIQDIIQYLRITPKKHWSTKRPGDCSSDGFGALEWHWTYPDTCNAGGYKKRVFMNLRLYNTEESEALMRHMVYFHGLGIYLAAGHDDLQSGNLSLQEFVEKIENFEPVRKLAEMLMSLSLSGLRNLHSYDHFESERLLMLKNKGIGASDLGVGQVFQCAECWSWLSTTVPNIASAAQNEATNFRNKFRGLIQKHNLEYFYEDSGIYVHPSTGVPDYSWAKDQMERCAQNNGWGNNGWGAFKAGMEDESAWSSNFDQGSGGATTPECAELIEAMGHEPKLDDTDLQQGGALQTIRAQKAAKAQADALILPLKQDVQKIWKHIWSAEIAEWWMFTKTVQEALKK